MLALVGIDPGKLVEIGYFTGNVNRQLAGIKTRDPLHPGLSAHDGATKCILTDPKRADHTHTSDYNSRKHPLKAPAISARWGEMG